MIALLTANNTFLFPTVYVGLLVILFLYLTIRIGCYCYIMYIKDYTKPSKLEYKQDNHNNEKNNVKESELLTNDDLLLLFKSKEKIAREMIEKRFPAPQITNTKFNAVLDNCKEVVEAQIKTLNALTPTEKTAYEIKSRKKLIKQVITKIDDLTNELILSEPSNIENVIGEMDDLIKSIKEYE